MSLYVLVPNKFLITLDAPIDVLDKLRKRDKQSVSDESHTHKRARPCIQTHTQAKHEQRYNTNKKEVSVTSLFHKCIRVHTYLHTYIVRTYIHTYIESLS